MLKKYYLKNGKTCRITFKYPNEENSKTAVLESSLIWASEAYWSYSSRSGKRIRLRNGRRGKRGLREVLVNDYKNTIWLDK